MKVLEFRNLRIASILIVTRTFFDISSINSKNFDILIVMESHADIVIEDTCNRENYLDAHYSEIRNDNNELFAS